MVKIKREIGIEIESLFLRYDKNEVVLFTVKEDTGNESTIPNEVTLEIKKRGGGIQGRRITFRGAVEGVGRLDRCTVGRGVVTGVEKELT